MQTDGSIVLGYNGVPWSKSFSKEDKLFFDAEEIKRPLGTFSEEMTLAAKEIGNKYPQEEIHVLYSGGMDSEGVVEALRRAPVPVRAVAIRAIDGSNEDEFKWIRQYSARTGFSNIDVVDFDTNWTNSSECRDLMNKVQTPYPSILWPYIPVTEHYKNKVFVSGIGESIIVMKEKGWCFELVEGTEYSTYKIFDYFNIPGPYSFYTWSVNLLMAWLISPFWNYMFSGKAKVVCSDDIKHLFYEKEFGLQPRDKIYWYNRARFMVDSNSIWNRFLPIPMFEWIGSKLASIELSHG